MSREELRERIAQEAARLMLRGKEQDFAAARKRAARWLKRRRLHREEIPSHQEIQVQLYALSGLMASEVDPMQAAQLNHWVAQILQLLQPDEAAWLNPQSGAAVAAGQEVQIETTLELADVQQRLQVVGISGRVLRDSAQVLSRNHDWRLRIEGQFPCEISSRRAVADSTALPSVEGWRLQDLQDQLHRQPAPEFEPVDDEHPDAYAVFEMLLAPLARVQWPTASHPEGDALYHSLQVFELGVNSHPYDEEFLLACLLHDVGYGVNPQHPVLAGIDALGTLVTDRTRFLIEQRPVGSNYLLTGECPRSLRKHADFEDVLTLARYDRDGRVAGAQVRDLSEALDYIRELDTLWDDDSDDENMDDDEFDQ